MLRVKIDGVIVKSMFDAPTPELKYYVKIAKAKYPDKKLRLLILHQDGDDVILEQHFSRPFIRIRRITGYLVSSMDNWNNAKLDELKNRVKHNGIQDKD